MVDGLSSLKAVHYGTIYQLHYKVQCHLGLSKIKIKQYLLTSLSS